mgnify:FL=1
MKKLVLLALAIILVSCNQTKIAYINVEDIMRDYEATKVMQEEMQAKQDQIIKELDSISAPFQLEVQEYQKNASRMSAQKRAQVEAELGQKQQALQARQQQASQQLQSESQVNSEAITKKIDSFVSTYATANGFGLVLGTSGNGTVMYGDDKLNITKEILEILNEEYSEE